MSDDLRPARMWRTLPIDVRHAAAVAFWSDEQAALEHAEGIALISRQIKFRPKSVMSLPVEKKAKHLSAMSQVSDLLAARLLVAYHLQYQRPMMGRFLDLLEIPHENGLINDEDPPTPAPEKIDAAATALLGEFPPDDVTRYFWTLLWQDPETWGALRSRPELTPA